jgi:cytochrome c oxidase subunit IV
MLRPPVGVAILGFFALMAGVAQLMMGFRVAGIVLFGPAETGNGMVLWGFLTIIVGAIFVAAAFALWATQPWAWLFTQILAIFGIIDAVFVMIGTGSLTDGIAVALLPLLVLWYLNDAEVRATFGVEKRA